jgi:uncharacterized protein
VAIAGGLLQAKVFHKRLRPRENAFTYNVFYLCFPLSQLDRLRGPVLSLDRFNLLSFHRRDYGARDGSEPEQWIRGVLARFGVTAADGEVVLMTHPRLLGFVFNPVSFWFCHDLAGQLRAVLAEVNNTFREHHSYLLFHPDQRPILPSDTLHSDKVFHVSPFLHVEGSYTFRFSLSERAAAAFIDYDTAEGPMLKTSVSGIRQTLTTIALLRMLLAFPLVSLKTVALIHWQALKIWLKRIPYVPKPKPPGQEIT